MSRKHLFAIVVLLGAAAVAGLLALTRTGSVGAAATQASSTEIAARTRTLDPARGLLERSLAEQPSAVATRKEPPPSPPRRAPSSSVHPSPPWGRRERTRTSTARSTRARASTRTSTRTPMTSRVARLYATAGAVAAFIVAGRASPPGRGSSRLAIRGWSRSTSASSGSSETPCSSSR